MIKRRDLTKDPEHVDYIINYEELDSKYSQLHLSKLDAKQKAPYMRKQVTGKDGKKHLAQLYICTEIYCSFDIETSTIFTTNIETGKKGYYSTMYLAQFGINNHVVLFRKWEHVLLFFQKLPRLLGLTDCTCLLVWVHNLDYENSYIKHRFDIDGTTYFGKNKQHPIKYLLQNHYIMHDSFSVTNSSLLKLGQMYNTKHQKAAGDLSHDVIRNTADSYALTDKEIGYAANDVLVLCDFSKIMIEDFYKKRGFIPDTATQILSKELQENAVIYGEKFLGPTQWKKIQDSAADEKQLRYLVLKRIHGKIFGFEYQEGDRTRKVPGMVDSKFFTPFDENEKQIPVEGKQICGKYYYDFYEWLFRGGYTKSNARYTSTDTVRTEGVENVQGYDYTSSYPFVQTICNYPMTAFRELKMSKDKLDSLQLHYGHEDFEVWRHIFILRFTEIESIDDFALESKSKAHIEGAKIIDNGRIRYAEQLTVCLTDCDYALYKLYYKWKDVEVLHCWRAAAGPLPEYFLHTVWINGTKKQTLKGVKGMEVEYMLAKGKFNSGYGLCCKQPVYCEYKLHNELTAAGYETTETVNHKYFGRSDIIEHSYNKYMGEGHALTEGECNEYSFDDAVRSSILSPFWGIWVSAFARYNLLSCMKKVSEQSEWITNDVVYCDTDSMYMLHPEKHLNVINEWNEFAAERVAERLPAEYTALRKLGHFDNIALDDSGGATDTFARFKTLGAKRYIKLYSKAEKHRHIRSIVPHVSVTVAGLPKGTLERYCSKHELDIFDYFKNDLDFCIDGNTELVKLARTYHDEVVKVNVRGEIMTEYSSCTLYPSTFKVTMNKVYKSFLNSILEAAGSKAYAKRGIL